MMIVQIVRKVQKSTILTYLAQDMPYKLYEKYFGKNPKWRLFRANIVGLSYCRSYPRVYGRLSELVLTKALNEGKKNGCV